MRKISCFFSKFFCFYEPDHIVEALQNNSLLIFNDPNMSYWVHMQFHFKLEKRCTPNGNDTANGTSIGFKSEDIR